MFVAKSNRLIASLAPGDRAALQTATQRVRLERGQAVLVAGRPVATLYFPEEAVLSLMEVLRDRSRRDVLLVGLEGVAGWSVLLGHDTEPYTAVVQLPGSALAVSTAALGQLCSARPGLRDGMLRYVGCALAQMSQSIVCARDGGVDRQLARWLLMLHDRVTGDVLAITHERLAELVGARRASVTDCLHVLEGDGVVRCARGQVEVRQRPALEQLAGELYGVAEDRYRDLVEPASKPATRQRA